jgi:DNA-directed RNA polymerase subunit beta'
VPLSEAAQQEARELMLSSNNLLSPADGSPIVSPTQDMVLGIYYLTRSLVRNSQGLPVQYKAGVADYVNYGDVGTNSLWLAFPPAGIKPEPGQLDGFKLRLSEPDLFQGFEYQNRQLVRRIGDAEDAIRQYERGDIRLDQLIDVEVGSWSDASESIEFSRELTTVGRIIFNQALPERLRFVNKIVRRADLKALIGVSVEKLGIAESARLADSLKDLGFKYSTSAGMSIAISDIPLSSAKKDAVQTSDKKVLALREQFEDGLITDEERYRNTVDIWKRTTQAVNDDMTKSIDPESTLFMMMDSGARGNKGQMGQLGGMRGLVADPSGKIMELPITASFRDGMQIDEYFNSTHGARKGLADTALRTADSGYLTRRLVDVTQDVITVIEDCQTTDGLALSANLVGQRLKEDGKDATNVDDALVREPLSDRIVGRNLAKPYTSAMNPSFTLAAGTTLTRDLADQIAEHVVAGNSSEVVFVRSPLSCKAERGICVACYGVLSASGKIVETGVPIGIIAAQSIGEPGTQLTMRTFHTGGAVGRTRRKLVFVLDEKGDRAKEFVLDAQGVKRPKLEEIWVDENELNNLEAHRGQPEFQMPYLWLDAKGNRKSQDKKDATGNLVKVPKLDKHGNPEIQLRIDRDEITKKPKQEEAKDANGNVLTMRVKTGRSVPVLKSDGTPQLNKDGSIKVAPEYELVPKMRDKKIAIQKFVAAKQFKVVKQTGFLQVDKTEQIDINEDVTGSAGGGLSRVEEVLEARSPSGKAEIALIDGKIKFAIDGDKRYVDVVTYAPYLAQLDLPGDAILKVQEGNQFAFGDPIATWGDGNVVNAPSDGKLVIEDGKYFAESLVPVTDRHVLRADSGLLVIEGQDVFAGDPLTEGPIAPADLVVAAGARRTELYMLDEVQKVYLRQGVTISDKHIEVVLRQLFRWVQVDEPGDTVFLPGQVTSRIKFEKGVQASLAEGGEPASANAVVMGVTKASLNTESFLSAASFQETTRVLTEAAITGARDYLVGLKENVIIGKLIPAGTGAPDKGAARKEAEKLRAAAALAGGDLPTDFGKDDFNVFLESEEGGASQDDVSQLVALLTEEKPAAEGETEANPFLADAAEAPKGDEGGA